MTVRAFVPAVAVAVLIAVPGAAHADPVAPARAAHAVIEGSGSSWAADAIDQWVADVTGTGLQVVYTGTGSAQGRSDFTNEVTDFAVSDLPYQGVDPTTGANDTPCAAPGTCRDFQYAPLVAGGVSFPYHLNVRGKPVLNLRLSGRTLALILTNVITRWSDAHITRDNGFRLPSIKIVPVVPSEGSATSALLSRYLRQLFPALWHRFADKHGPSLYWPAHPNERAQAGSNAVVNDIAADDGNGRIGFAEYSYALAAQVPVVRLSNAAGRFVLPRPVAVTIALRQTILGADTMAASYHSADYSRVFTANDPRAYPLSSETAMIVPTGASDPRMTTAKRQTLAEYLHYALCRGQHEVGPIGYAPLPANLVRASLSTVATLHRADANVDITGLTSC